MRGFVQCGVGKIPTLAFLRKKHETWNPSWLPWSKCYLLLRQQICNQIYHGKRKLQYWGLLKLPSFLHWQTKNCGHCWSRGSLQSKIRQYVQTFYLMYCSRGSLKTGYSFSGCFFVGVWNGCGVLCWCWGECKGQYWCLDWNFSLNNAVGSLKVQNWFSGYLSDNTKSSLKTTAHNAETILLMRIKRCRLY